MHIAHVIPFGLHPYSGVFTAVVKLATELARRGHNVEVWQLHDWPESETADHAQALKSAGVELVAIPINGTWLLGSAARRAVQGRPVDVVHLHNVFSPLNNFIARCLHVPYVLSPHGGYAGAVLTRHRIRKSVFRQLLELPMLRGAVLVCALTDAESREVRRFGFKGRMAVIPNGVEPTLGDVDSRVFRLELGLDERSRLVVFVGRLDIYYKRLDDLVHGTAQAPGWNLALIGPAWKDSVARLRQMIGHLRLDDRVHLVPPRRGRALQEALAAADLFVLLSRSEGLPMALLEALAHGVPALVSREVERSVGVAAAGAGWVTEPKDLGLSLGSVAQTDLTDWTRKRSAAASFAAAFDWADIAARYEGAVTEAIRPWRGGSGP